MNKIIKASVSGAIVLAALTALPILADESSSPTRSVSPSISRTPKSAVDLTCMQGAVDKRDSAIISAFGTYSSTAQAALGVRKNALVAAWGLTDAKTRRAAIRLAWKNYDLAVKSARGNLIKARKAAWEQFGKNIKTCRGQGETSEDQGHDSQL